MALKELSTTFLPIATPASEYPPGYIWCQCLALHCSLRCQGRVKIIKLLCIFQITFSVFVVRFGAHGLENALGPILYVKHSAYALWARAYTG